MHLLLIRLSSIGDVVLQTSLIAALKQHYGEKIKISFLVAAEFADLLDGHPMLSQVLTFDRRKQTLPVLFKKIINLHANNKIDCIIDLHGSLRSCLIRYRFFYIPSLVVDKRKLEKIILIYLKIDLLKKHGVITSQIGRVMTDFAGIFGYSNNLLEISSFLKQQTSDSDRVLGTITSTAEAFQHNSKPRHTKPTIVFAPSASFENKRWPIEYFVELADLLVQHRHEDIVILAGPKDDFCRAFDTLVKKYPERVTNLQGKTSLLESNQIIRNAKLVIGNDTGLIHIAESYGIKVFVIFGPTSESFGFIPHGPSSKYLSLDIWCRPCSATGAGKCFRAKRHCMLDLKVDTVFSEVNSVLAGEVENA